MQLPARYTTGVVNSFEGTVIFVHRMLVQLDCQGTAPKIYNRLHYTINFPIETSTKSESAHNNDSVFIKTKTIVHENNMEDATHHLSLKQTRFCLQTLPSHIPPTKNQKFKYVHSRSFCKCTLFMSNNKDK